MDVCDVVPPGLLVEELEDDKAWLMDCVLDSEAVEAGLRVDVCKRMQTKRFARW